MDDFEARMARARAERRLARVCLLRAMGGAPVPFCAPCEAPYADTFVVVHRDTYQATLGQWRATRFEGEEPVGHTTHRTFRGALDEIAVWRAVLPLARSLASLAAE